MSTPTLHDDRIAAIRTGVMLAVDQDISRRARRARRTIGLAAASVLVVGIGAVGYQALDLSGNNRATLSSESSAASGAADSAASGKAEAFSAPFDEREVITTGSVSVTVKQPRDSASKLSTYVERLGGRIDSREENGSGREASASLQIRVPAAKITTLIDALKAYGSVDDVSMQHDDVTAVSKDLDARIDALKISVGRLQDILADATTSRDVISAEKALTDRQSKLESLEAEKRSLSGQVELSTVSVNFSQKASVDSVEPGGFTGGLRDGWNGLVSTFNHTVEFVGVLLPWLLIAGLVFAAARLIARRKHWN